MLKHFTKEQILELSTVFGILPIVDLGDTLPVSDGVVTKGDMVWWKSEDGPEHVLASNDWENIRRYPQYYSIEKPSYKIEYLD